MVQSSITSNLPRLGELIHSALVTKHCFKCGWEWTIPGLPGRSDRCHSCGTDMRICRNCVSYDVKVAHQCRDRRADPVDDKTLATYCEYFDFVRREFKGALGADKREEKARADLKKLFGD